MTSSPSLEEASAPPAASPATPGEASVPEPASPVAFLASGPAILRRWVLAEVLGHPAPGLRWFARRRRGPAQDGRGG